MLQELNDLLGFQLLINILTNALVLILFGYFFVATSYNGKLNYMYSVQCTLYERKSTFREITLM